MEFEKNLRHIAVDEVVREAITREKALMDFYKRAADEVGPDAEVLMTRLVKQHLDRITLLENLLLEIRELRDLTLAMVD